MSPRPNSNPGITTKQGPGTSGQVLNAKQLLIDCGAIIQGHFILSSGLHSGHYVQCAKVFESPTIARKITESLSASIRQNPTFWQSEEASPRFEAVVSPAMGGVLAGYELARVLGISNIFAERPPGGQFAFRRGFSIPEGQSVIIMEDVITTGKSALEVVQLAKASGANVVGLACIIDRRPPQAPPLEYEVISVTKFSAPTYHPEAIPKELAAIPPQKPGSRVDPRPNSEG